MKQILTPAQSKDARRLAGVSQTTAANATGVSRTHLGLWEVNKYLLSDAALKALRDYYTTIGHALDDVHTDEDDGENAGTNNGRSSTQKRTRKTNGGPELEGFSLIDGFLVPDGLEHEPVENILAEIADNDTMIDELAATPAEEELFGGYCQKVSDQITQLMARNYTLIRELRGHETIKPCAKSETKASTNGNVLSQVFGKLFGFTDEEPKKPFGMTKTVKVDKSEQTEKPKSKSGTIFW